MPAPDRAAITAELEMLQLEEARDAAAQRKQAKVERENRAKAIQASLKRDNANQERIQSVCQHRKGGKGTAQMYMGNDTNFAVVTHTCSHGPTIVVCQRCLKVWRPPEDLPRRATAEQRAKYRVDLAEYRRALNFPTDNEPSGTVLFQFTPIEPEEAAA